MLTFAKIPHTRPDLCNQLVELVDGFPQARNITTKLTFRAVNPEEFQGGDDEVSLEQRQRRYVPRQARMQTQVALRPARAGGSLNTVIFSASYLLTIYNASGASVV